MNASKFPFTILALAPFGGVSPNIVTTDLSSLDEAVGDLAGTLSIPVPKGLCPEGFLTFNPSRIADFKPQGLVKIIPYLSELVDAGKFVEEATSSQIPGKEIAERLQTRWPDLPLDLSVPAAASKETQQKGKVDDILSMVAVPGDTSTAKPSGGKAGKGWKDQIEHLLSGLLEGIFADESFRRMEAAWAGAEILVKQGPVKVGEGVVLKLASIQDGDLADLLGELAERLSEEPPHLILVDHPFDNTPVSIELLEKVIEFAGNLLVPAAVWTGPSFFFLKGWKEVKKLPYLKHHLEDAAFAKWRKLREQAGSEWVVMTTNRFLVRQPYGKGNPSRPVYFQEEERPWVSPIWALGALAAKSVVTFGWPTRFTDYRNLSLENLAVSESEEGETLSTETALSEDRIMQLLEVGMTPLLGAIRKDTAFMPKETTLSGGSLKFQLFFNRIVGFLFKLKDELAGPALQADPGALLTSALATLFRESGHEPPGDLSIQAGEAEPGKPIPLRIAFTPPSSILPTSERLKFSLAW